MNSINKIVYYIDKFLNIIIYIVGGKISMCVSILIVTL